MQKKHMRGFFRALALLVAACAVPLLTSGPAAPAAAEAIFAAADLFTERDLKQTADLDGATACAVTDGEDIRIDAAGVYVLAGAASDVTVWVEAPEDAKVQLVLDGLTLTNAGAPCISIVSADKVFVTTAGDSALAVLKASSGSAVIESDVDLVLNGTAALTVTGPENGVVCGDDLKITGGVYAITAGVKAIAAKDSIRIAGGTLTLNAGTDGLHAESGKDNAKGDIYISGGALTIDAGDDAIHGNAVVQIDGGAIQIRAHEGIEGTYVQINGGSLTIEALDDGINGARKSAAYPTVVEINGGTISLVLATAETDGIDANGDIRVAGGAITVTGGKAFDYDGTMEFTGGAIVVDGEALDAIP